MNGCCWARQDTKIKTCCSSSQKLEGWITIAGQQPLTTKGKANSNLLLSVLTCTEYCSTAVKTQKSDARSATHGPTKDRVSVGRSVVLSDIPPTPSKKRTPDEAFWTNSTEIAVRETTATGEIELRLKNAATISHYVAKNGKIYQQTTTHRAYVTKNASLRPNSQRSHWNSLPGGTPLRKGHRRIGLGQPTSLGLHPIIGSSNELHEIEKDRTKRYIWTIERWTARDWKR